jgi:hypothetical protein
MPNAIDGEDADAVRRYIRQQDWTGLMQIVRERRTCEITGERLIAANAVAMMVTAGPGLPRLAVVSGAHWDGGNGALSSGDPNVDPDVLDGRKLSPRKDPGAGSFSRGCRQEWPECRPGQAKPEQRLLRPASRPTGPTPPVW